jgi:hypothetical protein
MGPPLKLCFLRRPTGSVCVGCRHSYQFLSKKPQRYEVFTVETMKNAVLCDVKPCGSCMNQRFGGWKDP